MKVFVFRRWVAFLALFLLVPSAFSSAISVPPASTVYTLTVGTNASVYCCSGSIAVNGTVTPNPGSGTSVDINVFNPGKTQVGAFSAPLNSFGDYNFTFASGGANWIDGVYSVNATWAPSISGPTYHASAVFSYSTTPPQPFAFTMSLSSSSGSAQQGKSVNTTVVLGLSAGISEPVTLSATGLPAGATATFSLPSCTPNCSSLMTVSTSLSTTPSTYSVTVKGTAASTSESVIYSLTVTKAPFLFDISVSPASGSVVMGNSVSSTVSLTLKSGNPVAVTFSATGLPAGATASFSAASCSPSCASTMTISTTSSTPSGTYAVQVAGSGGGTTNSTTFSLSVTAFKFDVSVSPSSGSLNPGQSVTSTVTLTLTSGVPPSLTLSASGLPSGATASFSPSSCAPNCSSTMTISTSASTPSGVYTVRVLASGTSASNSTTYTLTVIPFRFDIAVTPSSDTLTQGQSVTASVALTLKSGTPVAASLSVSGLPAGATASFSPASCTPTCTTTMTLSASSFTVAGTYTLQVEGMGGSTINSTSFALTVVPYRFDISSSPASGSVKPGLSVSATVSLTLKSGTAVPVTLSATGLPAGATASFSPASCSPSCSSAMTIATSVSTPPGVYTVTVTGSGGGVANSTHYALTVTPFKFDISASPPALSVVQGFTNSSSLTLTLKSGTAAAVAFSASGLPAGVSASFSPSSCAPNCSSSMSLAASKGTLPGTYSFTVTASGGGATNSTTMSLTVIAAKYLVTFSESGLALGAAWSVTLNGVTNSSTGTTVTFLEINGQYSYTVAARGYMSTPPSGVLTVNEAPLGVSLSFAPLKYAVTFTETGLASATVWSVVLGGTTVTSATAQAMFNEVNGTYLFTVVHVTGYSVTPSTGNVTVAGANVTVSLAFVRVYHVTFTQTGLPTGTDWTVTLGALTNSSTGTSMLFREPNGEYLFNATSPGYGPVSGYILVYNGAVTQSVSFVQYFPVTFNETGLATGQTWGVQTDFGFKSGNGTSITILAAVNSYLAYTVVVAPTYSATPASGSVFVTAAESVPIAFSPTYVVTFSQTGLPAGQFWYVYLNGEFNSSEGTSLEFRAPSGTFTFEVFASNSSYVPAPSSGSVTVSGATPSPVSVAFTELYPVTFTETGLAPYTCWTATLTESGANVTQYNYFVDSTFYVPNGAYLFYIGTCSALTADVTPSSGTVTVNSAPVPVALTFSTSAFTVKLVNNNGAAVSGMQVTESVGGLFADTWTTNSTGETTAIDVAPGISVTVTVATTGTIYLPFTPYTTSATTGNDLQTLTLQMVQVGFISGVVTFSNNATGVAGATVSVGSLSTQTGASGAYTITVPSGSGNITVTSLTGNFEPVTQAFAVSVQQSITANLTVTPILNGYIKVNLFTQYVGGVLEGPLPIDWRVAVHFSLYALRSDGQQFGPYALWVDNSLPVRGVPGDSFEVCITGSEADLPSACTTVVSSLVSSNDSIAATVTFDLIQPGVIKGTVVSAASGLPVTGGWNAAVYFVNASTGASVYVGSFENTSATMEFSVPFAGGYDVYVNSGSLSGTLTTNVLLGTLDNVGNVTVYPAGFFTDRPGNSLIASPSVTTVGSEVQMRGSYDYSGTNTLYNVTLIIPVPGGTSLVPGSILLNGAPQAGAQLGSDVVVGVGTLGAGATGVLRYTLDVTSAIGNETSFRPVLFINYTLSGTVTQELVGATTVTVVHISIVAPSQVVSTSVPVSGQGPPGSALQVYDGNSSIGSLTVPAGGYWSATVTLVNRGDPSNHTLYAVAKLASGVTERSGNVVVEYDTFVPTLVSWSMQQTDGRLVTFQVSQGVALFPYVVVPCMPITITLNITNPDYAFNVNVTIVGGGSVLATLGSDGLYTATIDYCSYGGLGAIYVSFNGFTTELANPTWVYDPSGYVYEALPSNRLQGVTATIYQLVSGNWVPWDAQAFGQQNNETTNAFGQYGWYVPQGYWKVVFTLPGYVTAQTEILDVPPPATGVNVGLVSLAPPVVTGVSAVNINGTSYVQVQFSKYVRFSSAAAIFVELGGVGGSNITGTVAPVNLQTAPNGEHLATEFRFVPGTPLVSGETYGVLVGKSVESYANVTMGTAYSSAAKVQGSLQYVGKTSAPGGTITLGDSLSANATTTDPLATTATFTWVNPQNLVVSSSTSALSGGFAASKAFTPDANGTWTAEIAFGTSTTTFKTVSVPFLVASNGTKSQAQGSSVALLSVGTGSGSFTANTTKINGIYVAVTNTNASLNAAVDTFVYSSPPSGVPAVPSGGSSLLYFDVKITNVNVGTANICETNAALTGKLSASTVMYYYDSTTGSWVAATGTTITLPDTVCGNVPVADLTGTAILVANPSGSGGSGGGSGGGGGSPPPATTTTTVTFTENGLPSGASWSVSMGGTTQSSTSSQIEFTNVNEGSYGWSVSGVPIASGEQYGPIPAYGVVSVSGPSTVSVTFVEQYALTMVAFPTAGGYTTPAGTVWVGAGDAETIQAVAAPGYAFAQWSTSGSTLTVADSSAASTTVTVDGPGTITAQFNQVAVTTTTTTAVSTASQTTTTAPPTSSSSTVSTTTAPSSTTAPTVSSTPPVPISPDWLVVSGVAVAFVLIVVASLLVKRRVR
ncbi:MAG: hypothetical protein JRM74_04720 [Nitrososphaerota archaeon]|nr:hypothetical protein [Nitrososphaerota archaeon]